MRNLIYLIIRYSALILFITLECVAFYLIVNYNKSQKEIWSYSSNLLSGRVYEKLESLENYFTLNTENDSLLRENARLRQTIINYRVSSSENAFDDYILEDSLQAYELIPAFVCNKTLNLRNNFFTLNKGGTDGVKIGMGVISEAGLVGIVKAVSDHFSTVILLTNSQSRISALIKNKEYPGSLVWSNPDPSILNLSDIPKHANIEIGDSVITSGYGICFPPDIFIGTIEDFSIEGGSNNYKIDIHLDYGFHQISHVYVINYKFKTEKDTLLATENE